MIVNPYGINDLHMIMSRFYHKMAQNGGQFSKQMKSWSKICEWWAIWQSIECQGDTKKMDKTRIEKRHFIPQKGGIYAKWRWHLSVTDTASATDRCHKKNVKRIFLPKFILFSVSDAPYFPWKNSISSFFVEVILSRKFNNYWQYYNIKNEALLHKTSFIY